MADKITGARAAQPAIKEGGGGGLEKVDIISNEDETKNRARNECYYWRIS